MISRTKKIKKTGHIFKLVKTSSPGIEITKPTIKPPIFYDIEKPSDIKKLEQACRKHGRRFSYIYDNHNRLKKYGIKLIIAPTDVLGGQYGVFVTQATKVKNATFGCYLGKSVRVNHENPKSNYLFEIVEADGKVKRMLDALNEGDVTSFINSSANSTTDVVQKKINGKVGLYFYLNTPLKAGEMLTFDYGAAYFEASDFVPYFLDKTDNWLTPAEKVYANRADYCKNLYRFDEKTRVDLALANKDWLLPKSFEAICKHNVAALERILLSSPPDLLAYSVAANKICAYEKQQHITPLMMACYLGNDAAIEALLKKGADYNRCMLRAGLTPLACLLKGYADEVVMADRGIQLLKKMRHPFIKDRYQLGLLHYAIKADCLPVVKQLINRAMKEGDNPFEVMFDRAKNLPKHANLDDCLRLGHIEMLKTLLVAIAKNPDWLTDDLNRYIERGVIFGDKLINATPMVHLKSLRRIIVGNSALARQLKRTKLMTKLQTF